MESCFHAGELALQERAGVREKLEAFGQRAMRSEMPEQHRELFTKLPTLWVGSLDAHGRPWASMLIGRPGFIEAPDARHLRIAAEPGFGDPLRAHLRVGAPLGLLGLEPATRRRNRMNGTLVEVAPGGFTVRVDQSFGNCPQYIQAREPRWLAGPADFAATRSVTPEGPRLQPATRRLVERSDTLFIATAASGGVDVSHRGGRPGFVRVDDVGGFSALTIPDFRGNAMFATLGNIVAHPRAGLVFVDFDSGDLLQLTGTAELIWNGPEVAAFAGAQHLLRISVEQGVWMPSALPLRWSAPKQAPQLAATGTWR